MTIKTTLITAASLLFLSANASASSSGDAISAAEKAQQKAASVGYEWRDTGKMIKQAKKLAKEGKTEEAMQLARQAEEQGKDAYAQHMYEAERYQDSH